MTKKAFDLWVFLFLISPAEFCSLALVDAWDFSKSRWSLDQQVTWKSRWGSFTLTYNPTKFDGHWCCEIGDAPFCEFSIIIWYMSHVAQWLWSTQLKSQLTIKLVAIVLVKVKIELFKKIHMITWSMGHVSHWVRYPQPKWQRL